MSARKTSAPPDSYLWPRVPDQNHHLRKSSKWRKPDYWNPSTIYQRSYLPVKSDVVIAGPLVSKWKRPKQLLSGLSTYIHDFSGESFMKAKWIEHPHQAGKKQLEVPTSEYEDRYKPHTKEQFEEATRRVDLSVKSKSSPAAGYPKYSMRPPMFTSTIYSSTFNQPVNRFIRKP